MTDHVSAHQSTSFVIILSDLGLSICIYQLSCSVEVSKLPTGLEPLLCAGEAEGTGLVRREEKTSVRPGVADKYHEVVITEEAQSLGLQHGCALSISEGFKTQLDEGLSNLI